MDVNEIPASQEDSIMNDIFTGSQKGSSMNDTLSFEDDTFDDGMSGASSSLDGMCTPSPKQPPLKRQRAVMFVSINYSECDYLTGHVNLKFQTKLNPCVVVYRLPCF